MVFVFNLLFANFKIFMKTKRYAKRLKGTSLQFFPISKTDAYSEPNQTSKMELLGKQVSVTAVSH